MAKLAENIFHQAVRAGSDDNITLIAIKVAHDAEIDPLFAAAKQMVIETRTPSVALVQRTFLINYTRASSFLDAMEGDIVSFKDERGARRMLTGETVDYL
jgi:DNA segregation ATPase FtsK/SpoIIIE-like protein